MGWFRRLFAAKEPPAGHDTAPACSTLTCSTCRHEVEWTGRIPFGPFVCSRICELMDSEWKRAAVQGCIPPELRVPDDDPGLWTAEETNRLSELKNQLYDLMRHAADVVGSRKTPSWHQRRRSMALRMYRAVLVEALDMDYDRDGTWQRIRSSLDTVVSLVTAAEHATEPKEREQIGSSLHEALSDWQTEAYRLAHRAGDYPADEVQDLMATVAALKPRKERLAEVFPWLAVWLGLVPPPAQGASASDERS